VNVPTLNLPRDVDEVEVAISELTASVGTVKLTVAGSIENSEDDAGSTLFPALSFRITLK